MHVTQLFRDDRAVSPVIGVILMVAITVILAAVIGTFVLGLGSSFQTQTPQVQFGFEVTSTGNSQCVGTGSKEVTITHETGDSLDSSQVTIHAGGATGKWSTCAGDDGQVTAGDSAIVNADGGSTVRVTWSDPSSDTSATLGKFDVPS